MVAFTSLLVLATAGLSAVSALAIPKRDLATDAVNIGNALKQADNAVLAINPEDEADTTASISQGLSDLASTLNSATISEQGASEIPDSDVEVFMKVFDQFDALIGDIENAVPDIQKIPGLADVMQTGLLQDETATSDYINTIIPLLSPDLQSAASGEEQQILDSFQKVRASLTASSS